MTEGRILTGLGVTSRVFRLSRRGFPKSLITGHSISYRPLLLCFPIYPTCFDPTRQSSGSDHQYIYIYIYIYINWPDIRQWTALLLTLHITICLTNKLSNNDKRPTTVICIHERFLSAEDPAWSKHVGDKTKQRRNNVCEPWQRVFVSPFDSVGANSEINTINGDFNISDIHTPVSTNGAWNSPWSSFRLYYQLVAIFHFNTKHSFPLITSAGITRLYKHVPRYKVAFTEALFIEGSGEVYAYSFDWLFRTVKTNKTRRTCK